MKHENNQLLQKSEDVPFVYSAIVKFDASSLHIFSILKQIVDKAFDVKLGQSAEYPTEQKVRLSLHLHMLLLMFL